MKRVVCKVAGFVFDAVLNFARFLSTMVLLSVAILLAKYDSSAEF